jgi:hypothetical protein
MSQARETDPITIEGNGISSVPIIKEESREMDMFDLMDCLARR